MKHKPCILNAMVLSGAIGLAGVPAWSAGNTSSGGSASDRGQIQSGGYGSTESERPSGSGMSSRRETGREGSGRFSADNIKEVQQALKDKGHDPGSVDGIMGQQTQQALRSFQQKEGLKATGMLDDETAQKLGVSVAPRGGNSSDDLKPGRSEMPRSPSSVEEQRDQKKNAD